MFIYLFFKIYLIYAKEQMFLGAAFKSGYSALPLRSDEKSAISQLITIKECREREGEGKGWS